MSQDFFISPRAPWHWTRPMQRVGGIFLTATFIAALTAFAASLLAPQLLVGITVGAGVCLVIAVVLLGVAIAAEWSHEKKRQAALLAFLQTEYQGEHFLPRNIERLSYGGSLSVADNGVTRQRIRLGSVTAEGEPVLISTERSGKLIRKWIV